MLKNERGSFMVEAAIIFPVILLTVLILITLSIMIHDVYVSKLAVTVFEESTIDVNVDKEIRMKMINDRSINEINVVSDSEGKQKEVSLMMEYKLPLVGAKSTVSKYKQIRHKGLQKIMYIELMGDVFDELSISKVSKGKYDILLKTVLSSLEND